MEKMMKILALVCFALPVVLASVSCGLSESSSSKVMNVVGGSDNWKQLFEGKWSAAQSDSKCKIFKAIGLNVAFKPGSYEFNKGLTTWTGRSGYLLVDKKIADGADDTFCLSLPADIDNTFQMRQEWLAPVVVNGENVYVAKAEPIATQPYSVTYRTRFAATLHGTSCGILFPKLNFTYHVGLGKCLIEQLFVGEEARKFDKKAFQYFAHTISSDGSTFRSGSRGSTPQEAVENLSNGKNINTFSKVAN